MRGTFWTRAAISASCVPMKLVTSTLAYSHFNRWNVILMLIWTRKELAEDDVEKLGVIYLESVIRY